MKIRYKVEFEDLVAFNQYFCDTSPEIQRQRRVALYPLLAVCLAVGFMQSLAYKSGVFMLVWIAFSIAVSIWYNRVSRKVSPKRVKRLYANGKDKGVLCEHEIELLEDGIYERTDVGEGKLSFSGIERIGITDTHIFIFVGSMSAFVIPKSKVIEGDLDGFTAALRKNLPA